MVQSMKKIMTAAYFILTFILIFIGLGFMKKMLKVTQDKTLSVKGNIPLRETYPAEDKALNESNNIPLAEYDPTEDELPSGEHLSESIVTDSSIDTVDMSITDLKNVVAVMNSISAKKLHEPYGSQINMEEAVYAGHLWIDIMCGILPAYGIEFTEDYEMVRAELYESSFYDVDFPVSREYLSFWYIEYQIKDLSELKLFINAVTGKVLQVNMISYIEPDFREYDTYILDTYLIAFAEVYGLESEIFSGKVISSEENQAPFICLSIAGGELYLILETGQTAYMDSYCMNIYFSTTPKEEKIYDSGSNQITVQ